MHVPIYPSVSPQSTCAPQYSTSEEQLFQYHMKMREFLKNEAGMSDSELDSFNLAFSQLCMQTASGESIGANALALECTEKRIVLYRVFCKLLMEKLKRDEAPNFEEIFSKGVLLGQKHLLHRIQEGENPVDSPTAQLLNAPNTEDTPLESPFSPSNETDISDNFFLLDNHHEQFVQTRQFSQLSPLQKVLRFVAKHLFGLFPGIYQLISYFDKQCPKRLFGDITGGLSVAAISIPQCMSYGMLAGLPPVYGLYTSLVPMLAYCLFGTSRHISIAPVSMIALMNAAAIEELPTLEAKVQRSVLISFQSGLFLCILGFLRLGFLIDFLSEPVLSGFTSAVGVVIIVSQLRYLLGVSAASAKGMHFALYNIAKVLPESQWQSVLLGVCCLVILILCQKFYLPYKWKGKKKKLTLTLVPVNLILVILAIILMYIVKNIANSTIDENDPTVTGIRVLGELPNGFPSPTVAMFQVSFSEFLNTLTYSISIGLIGFMQTWSSAKIFAERLNYPLVASQELIAAGMASLCGSFFRSFSPTGSLSRTSVAVASGAKTQVHSFIVFIVLTLTTLFLTPLFYYLPKPLLAAIIIAAVYKIVKIGAFFTILHTKPVDALSHAVAFLATLFIGLDVGVIIAAVLSLFLVILRSSRARVSVMGRIPGTQEFAVVKSPSDTSSIQYKGIMVLRFDADILFINSNHLQETVLKMVGRSEYVTQALILDLSSVSSIDTTGLNGLMHMYANLEKKHHVRVYFANMKYPVWVVCARGKMMSKIAEDRFYSRTVLALSAAQKFITSRALEAENEDNEVEIMDADDKSQSGSKGDDDGKMAPQIAQLQDQHDGQIDRETQSGVEDTVKIDVRA